MSRGFEERLERELLEAARRRSADRPATAAVRLRLPRPSLAAAAASVALAVLAVLVIALPRSGDAPRDPLAPQPLPQSLPQQCDAAAERGRLKLVRTPVDRRLLDAYAVLRRPQTRADRSVCPGSAATGDLNPAGIRRVGHDDDGHPVFLVPMAGVPDLERAAERGDIGPPWEVPDRTGPRLCPTIVYPDSGAPGICHPPSYFGRGRFPPLHLRPRLGVSVGVFSDGVTAIDVTFGDGTVRQLVVRDNVAILTLRGRTVTPSTAVAGYRLLDADGDVVAARGADRGLRLPGAHGQRQLQVP